MVSFQYYVEEYVAEYRLNLQHLFLLELFITHEYFTEIYVNPETGDKYIIPDYNKLSKEHHLLGTPRQIERLVTQLAGEFPHKKGLTYPLKHSEFEDDDRIWYLKVGTGELTIWRDYDSNEEEEDEFVDLNDDTDYENDDDDEE